jgi:coproporphyrinogen III oxidase
VSAVDTQALRAWFTGLQLRIVEGLEAIDGDRFAATNGRGPEGGGGVSRMIEDGAVLERGGVLFSHVTGDRLPPPRRRIVPSLPDAPGKRWAFR